MQAPQEEQERDIGQVLLERIKTLHPDLFETLVRELVRAHGLGEVRVTQRSHDGGIDGDGIVPFFNVRVAFQAKRFQSQSVGVDMVAAFKGRIGNFDRGVFVTTSTFTAGAKEVAEQTPAKVMLVDGAELVAQMMKHGLGITRVPVVETHLDEDFFAGLEGGSQSG